LCGAIAHSGEGGFSTCLHCNNRAKPAILWGKPGAE